MKNQYSKLLEKKRRESIKGRSMKDIGHQIMAIRYFHVTRNLKMPLEYTQFFFAVRKNNVLTTHF